MKINPVKDLAPALIVLLISIIFALIYRDFAPLSKTNAPAWMTPVRFLRFALILCSSFIILPKVFNIFVKKLKHSLVILKHESRININIFKHWFFRPMQGIGIGLIFSTKLIAVLQLISGPSDATSILISGGKSQPGRLLLVILITFLVSLLLSLLWAFDDTGIRYFNKKDNEVRMVGKYLGSMIPFLFGIYGIYNLLTNYPNWDAVLLILEISIVLYPPMSVFAVLHTYFLNRKISRFETESLEKGVIVFQIKK